VTYSYARFGVTVDIDGAADDGGIGEGDNVRTDVEHLLGGPGDDDLTGDGDANFIDGRDGNDTLHGRDGPDALVGGSGRDTLSAEAGDDSLDTLDGAVDSSSCGAGHDSVVADSSDALGHDCEATKLTSAVAPLRITKKPVRVTSRGVARMRLRCTRAVPDRCSGRVTLTLPPQGARTSATHRRRVLGTALFSARRGRLTTVQVRLSRNGRRRVLRRRRIRCRVSVALRGRNGTITTVRSAVTLTAAKRSAG
jgi:Ca2+-binding RTX toxin-like protein